MAAGALDDAVRSSLLCRIVRERLMKVFVQIPCLNEEMTLPAVLASIPQTIDGVDECHIVVIDDGSSDRTIDVAKENGVVHFVRHTRNMGLARAFADGVNYALAHGADIVVNTDGDNQYPSERIGELIAPIQRGTADIVVGDRQTSTIDHFSPLKRVLQRFGSWMVNKAAGTDIPDAASGFRAYSRESLMRLNVVTTFSYCMETIIQAGHKRLRLASVPITTNAKTRESRLFRSMWHHVAESSRAIIRSYLMFRPLAFFIPLGAVLTFISCIPFVRYLVLWVGGAAGDHIQSLILGAALLVGGLLSFALGLLADLMRINRILLEDTLERSKRLQYGPSYAEGRSQISARLN
jgi:glycosyltransferase involved in cell wall biosynthesis